MAITVKKAVLWRKEVDNRPGTLASALVAAAGADLQVVAYRYRRVAGGDQDGGKKAGRRPFVTRRNHVVTQFGCHLLKPPASVARASIDLSLPLPTPSCQR